MAACHPATPSSATPATTSPVPSHAPAPATLMPVAAAADAPRVRSAWIRTSAAPGIGSRLAAVARTTTRIASPHGSGRSAVPGPSPAARRRCRGSSAGPGPRRPARAAPRTSSPIPTSSARSESTIATTNPRAEASSTRRRPGEGSRAAASLRSGAGSDEGADTAALGRGRGARTTRRREASHARPGTRREVGSGLLPPPGSPLDLAVIGVGHVGLVTAACLADLGHQVLGVDDDAERIAVLQRGETCRSTSPTCPSCSRR
jgi:hypothetical protein